MEEWKGGASRRRCAARGERRSVGARPTPRGRSAPLNGQAPRPGARCSYVSPTSCGRWRPNGAGARVPRRRIERPRGHDQSQLVFVGNWQDPCPRRLLLDADLEPVDIVTWQIIRIHAEASKLVAFPSYRTLMSALKVSRATLARALAVLRLTRWLPLCAALRDPHGRFAGHVYALNG